MRDVVVRQLARQPPAEHVIGAEHVIPPRRSQARGQHLGREVLRPQDRQGDAPELVVGIVIRVLADLRKHPGQDRDGCRLIEGRRRSRRHRAQPGIQVRPGRGLKNQRDHVGRAGLPGEHEGEVGLVGVGLGHTWVCQGREDRGELPAQARVGEIPAAPPPQAGEHAGTGEDAFHQCGSQFRGVHKRRVHHQDGQVGVLGPRGVGRLQGEEPRGRLP